MIDLFSSDTPNGKKISIMLEEIGFEYVVKKMDLSKGDQFKEDFKKISPFSKIPAIIDHSNNKESVFESGAILIYLAEKSGKFYEKENKLKIDQWLMAQMGSIGPFIGQYHFFYKFNKGLSEVGEKRYFEMTKKVYEVLENHLSKNNYLAGENYSIADIATWPWIARHQWHDIGLKNYDNLCDWYIRIADRPAVVKGYKFLDKNSEIPKP
ncbi:glutathione S-transferase family protein [Candidatus Pelagibacter sp. RS40]|uniref:glutathione S-transferase family protein n=1 Tax=Candidatus Pelagibacter sp. RS40 TaxID=1977865 RepID=UPI000A168CAB|nr:glutathione binding-like protein [Candidatus Pelagibacter sp. RS40]ARJ48757.1 glutathione S-transferase [Candidatus Pelagibacter sp. RS40]